MKNLCTHASGHTSPATVPVTLNSKNRKVFSRRPNNILVILLSVSLLLLSQFSTAQAPQQFSFQGVARDATGKIVANTQISVRTQIHKDGPNGPIVFTETQIIDTNSQGIFNLIIGGLTGGLDDVNWASDNCFIQTEIDIAGGANFVNLGTTQIKSVPYSLVSRQWINNIPIVQTGGLGVGSSLPVLQNGPTLIWYPKKAAFRVGEISVPTLGDDNNIGVNSFGSGVNAFAKGKYSVAMGYIANANNDGAVAIGIAANALGNSAIAMGQSSVASGENSVAIGRDIYSKSKGGITFGLFNDDFDTEGVPQPTDRIFQLGNGTNAAARSNALTILRNGFVGIGNNVLSPQYLLDLGGRMRIRHEGQTAGIHFNNSANNEDGFVGMKTDDEVGLFVNGAWRFWVTSSNAYVNGNIVNTSDRRLKKIINPVSRSLSSLRSLQGYNYYWNDIKQGRDLQTGLIAQEVEKRFPELVTTNKDGYKAVNYIGLIPHLIEAVKELDKRTEEVAALKKELAEVKEINKRVIALEVGLKSLLTGNTSAIGKSHAK